MAPSAVPYVVGGAEKLWWGLLDTFRHDTAHEVELIKIPSPERNFRELIASYETFSTLDLNHFELVISTKYPAWMVKHWNHWVYLQHKLRGLYDTYPDTLSVELGDLPHFFQRLVFLLSTEPEREKIDIIFAEIKKIDNLLSQAEWLRWFGLPSSLVRKIIHWLDAAALKPGEINKYMAISENVKQRDKYFPEDTEIQVIHHPSDLESRLRSNRVLHSSSIRGEKTPRPVFFTASRLDASKRIDLIINAVKETDAKINLRIAGSGPEQKALQILAADEPRIKFLGRITDAQICEEYRQAICVLFVPVDEDYGLVTVEAMQAGTPVLSVTDAGGVTELVVHEKNGWLVEPSASSLAIMIKRLSLQPSLATDMTKACLKTVDHVNWADTMKALLSQTGRIDNLGFSEKGKPNEIVVAVSFPIYPAQSGGQNRVYNLYKHIAQYTPVTLVTLCNLEEEAFEGEIAPGLKEIRVPKSQQHQSAERELEASLNASIGDIFVIDHIGLTPNYLNALKEAVSHCELVVASHPYLYPAIRQVYSGSVFYDSHNVEYDMKVDVLSGSSNAEFWLELVKRTEQACCDDAVGIAVCSDQDKERLQSLYSISARKTAVIANGVDSSRIPWIRPENRLRSRWRELPSRASALFIGSWHGPNIDAAKFIVDILAPECSEIDFLIVGSVCRYFEAQLVPENVKLFGALSESSKNDVLSVAQVAINPMNSGAGSNLKMAEYACAGLPVLTTAWGLRGLAFKDHEHVISADLPDFSNKLQYLVNQTEQGALNTMIVAAKSVAVEQHDWKSISADCYLHIVSVCHSS